MPELVHENIWCRYKETDTSEKKNNAPTVHHQRQAKSTEVGRSPTVFAVLRRPNPHRKSLEVLFLGLLFFCQIHDTPMGWLGRLSW